MKNRQKAPKPPQKSLQFDPDVEIDLDELIRQVQLATFNDHNLRMPDMKVKTGLSPATIWLRVKAGLLPPPYHTYHLGNTTSRSVAWSNLEVGAVLAANRYASRTGKKIDLCAFVAKLVAANSSLRSNPNQTERHV